MAAIDDIATLISIIRQEYSSVPQKIREMLQKSSISEVYQKVKKGGEKEIPSAPVWEHNIVYDSSSDQLEPIYFWILDFMQDLGFKVEKLVDNFAASVGGGYFAEMGARATKMQEESMKMMQTIGVLLKSLINILYDLKEFEIRLNQYDQANSNNPKEKEVGILALKQIWMDKVDMQRGTGSINALTYQIGFTTLRDAFMIAKSVEDVDKMDLNERVKNILKQKIAEFFEWKKRSEIELRKRFEIEKAWLKSQVASLKTYARWAKPYLRAAEQLMMKEKQLTEPALVTAFNTMLLELSLLCTKKVKVNDAIGAKELPQLLEKVKLRDFYMIILINFNFRSIPQRVSQAGHYAFGGRVEISFKSFVLNNEELDLLKQEWEKQDLMDSLKLAEMATEESLIQLADELNHFLEEKDTKDKASKEGGSLFNLFKGKEKQEKKGKKQIELKDIKKEKFEETIVRKYAEQQVAANCFKVYDVYKKSHNMASFTEPSWEYPPSWRI